MMFIDAILVKVKPRTGHQPAGPSYVAFGVSVNGERDIPGAVGRCRRQNA